MVATDLDGTLLSATHQVSEENLEAIRRLQSADIEVVLASGRHYNSMHRIAAIIPGIRWIVSSQGGEVSNLDRSQVLHRVFLAPEDVGHIMDRAHQLDLFAAAYTPDGLVTESIPVDEEDVLHTFQEPRLIKASRRQLLELPVFKIVWISTPERISELARQPPVLGHAVQSLQTHRRIFEYMPQATSKGAALDVLATHLGIRPEQTAVFGDGENDIPMFDWAGISVAMPRSWPAALSRATLVGPDAPLETAFARAVDCVFAPAG